VSETGDKRRRRDLDLFVLALIDSGLTTPYQLQQGADLSPGATIPALRRLLEARLVVQGKPGPRGRTEHKITAEGRRHLKSNWRDLVECGPSGDLEADLRVALLALWLGGSRRMSADFLRQSAARKLASGQEVIDVAMPAPLSPLLARWYRDLRSAAAEVIAQGYSDAFLSTAKALPRNAAMKQKTRRARGSIR
jgi:DNA-binding PadR family transcriptional regulator